MSSATVLLNNRVLFLCIFTIYCIVLLKMYKFTNSVLTEIVVCVAATICSLVNVILALTLGSIFLCVIYLISIVYFIGAGIVCKIFGWHQRHTIIM